MLLYETITISDIYFIIENKKKLLIAKILYRKSIKIAI